MDHKDNGKKYGKRNQEDVDQILDRLKWTLENQGTFFVIAAIQEGVMITGTKPDDMARLITQGMMIDKRTRDIVLEACTMFLMDRVLDRVCPTCEHREECDRQTDRCHPRKDAIDRIREIIDVDQSN